MSVPKPTHTQVPNIFIDYWMARLNAGAFKCLMAIARKTIGWHKEVDAISLSQLQELTGLSRPGVIASLAELQEHELITAERSEQRSTRYSINYESTDSGKVSLPQVVNSVDHPSKLSLPDLVNSVNPQKKGKETRTKERKKVTNDSSRQPPEWAVSLAELLYKEHTRTDPGYLANKSESEVRKKLARWASDIEKISRLDGRDYQTIEHAIQWAKDPECFWAPNIISGAKLRDKFPTLIAQMSRDSKSKWKGPSSSDEIGQTPLDQLSRGDITYDQYVKQINKESA